MSEEDAPQRTPFGTLIPAESAYDADADRVDITAKRDWVSERAPNALID